MKKENNSTKKNNAADVTKMIDQLVANAQQALAEYMKMDQEQVDKVVHSMTLAGLDQHMYLAKTAVEETKRGLFEDKVIKNIFATEYIYHSIANQKTVGVIEENDLEGYVEVAEPVGVVAGITPVTNPTSTTMFKALICAKTRNPIIFAFHPSAQKCSAEAARILKEAAVENGAPEHCIQWIELPSMEATSALMNHPEVSLILATGGAGMVKSAYSCGKPALGVGPGNVPCYINKNVNIGRACTDLMISKTFDNGMICASEQAVIVDEAIKDKFEAYMKEHNCYFTNEEETALLTKYVMNTEKMAVNPVPSFQDWGNGRLFFLYP
jgi:acetaldehyde dehydrogenase/alcohol dehydrogenase